MMNQSKFELYLLEVCFCSLLFANVTVHAQPGVLVQMPLLTANGGGATGAPSNVFIVMDDSGSMSWDFLTKKHWNSCRYDPAASRAGCSSIASTGDDFTNALDWRNYAASANVLQYDPHVTYIPWKKGDGTSFPNAVFTAAKTDPLTVYSTTLKNLSGSTFEVAHDTHGFRGAVPSVIGGGKITTQKTGTVTTTTINSAINRTEGANGIIDYWDNHTNYTISTTGVTKKEITYNPTLTAVTGSYTCNGTTAIVIPASSLTVTGCGTNNINVTVNNTQSLNQQTGVTTTFSTGINEWGRTLAQEQTNYANWYQYYRVRINVAKGAVAQVIDTKPNYRYGLSLTNGTTFVEVPPKYDVGTTNLKTNVVPANVNLLTKLFEVNPGSSTPLPNALDKAGKYFQDSSTTAGLDALSKTSPIIYECQQNFAIMMTDGYWNQALTNGNINDEDKDGVAKTLADVASYYYKMDLSPTIWDDKVPTSAFDTNAKQHLVSSMVSFGLVGNLLDLNGDGWPDPDPVNQGFALTEDNPHWAPAPNVLNTSGSVNPPEKIDDLWHAAYNAKGRYVSAASPDEVTKALSDHLNIIAERDFQANFPAVSFSLATSASNHAVYLKRFSKPTNGNWVGDVLAYNPPGNLLWSADAKLIHQAVTHPTLCNKTTHLCNTNRKLFTSNTAGTLGVPFQWDYLTAVQRADLGTNSSGLINAGTPAKIYTTPSAEAFARLAYLRGDTRHEKGKAGAVFNFRNRDQIAANGAMQTHLLGDIVHSDTTFVGIPNGSWPNVAPFPTGVLTSTGSDTSSYANFKRLRSLYPRPEMVYVGANDGMLHGFYAATTASFSAGTEAMAYIPNTLFAAGKVDRGLHYLTDTAYSHRYYVDMPSVVGDVFISTATDSTPRWHTLLIGGEMAGGRGIFALDVTDPSLFSTEDAATAKKIALWEFDNSNDADMGYSYAIPSIVMTNAIKNGKNRWAVVFGNGYNNSGKGQAALFVVFLDPDLNNGWTEGIDYLKIHAPVATDPSAAQVNAGINCDILTNCNGLSTPQPYSTLQNSVTDRVYAGDLKGNLWAFDLSSANPENWKVAYGDSTNPQPLFTAHQAITSRPVVVKNSRVNLSSPINMLVLFGTGQYLNNADAVSTAQQAIYGVWDHGFSTMTTSLLVQQTFATGNFYDNTGADVTQRVRVLSQNPVNYTDTAVATGSPQGWFINFPTAKERMIVNPKVKQDKYLSFNTWIPEGQVIASNDICTANYVGGTGYFMNVDLFTGATAAEPLMDINADGLINGNDKVATTPVATVLSDVVAGVPFSQRLLAP